MIELVQLSGLHALQIFKDLEKACSKDCILSSNTSTIDITLVGAQTHALDRLVGAHFFSPAHIMPLLEIVRTPKSSPQVSKWYFALSYLSATD